MSDAFYGEIRMFAGTYAPLHWAFCDGTLLPVNGNEALASLLGSTYGGDGRSNFALPELRGRVPMHLGTGPGLTPRLQGQRFGMETVTLELSQIPSHNHPIQASGDLADRSSPAGSVLAKSRDDGTDKVMIYGKTSDQTKIVEFASTAVKNEGDGQGHTNMMPAMCINFIICLQGIYPSRN